MEQPRSYERNGVDVGVALAAGARAGRPDPSVATDAAFAPAPARGLKARLRAWLRPVARRLARLLQPVVSPLAFRSRAYLLAPLRADLDSLRVQQSHFERELERRERETARQQARAMAALTDEVRMLRSQLADSRARLSAASPADASPGSVPPEGRP